MDARASPERARPHADLRRRGFAPAQLKQLISTLRDYFRRRLAETPDEMGELRLPPARHAVFLRQRDVPVVDVVVASSRPLSLRGFPPCPAPARRAAADEHRVVILVQH